MLLGEFVLRLLVVGLSSPLPAGGHTVADGGRGTGDDRGAGGEAQ